MIDGTLTLKVLSSFKSGQIMATGLTDGGPGGVHLIDKPWKVRWVAITGHNNDWAVYAGPEDWSPHAVARSGDKVNNINNVKKVVPCDDAAAERYRG